MPRYIRIDVLTINNHTRRNSIYTNFFTLPMLKVKNRGTNMFIETFFKLSIVVSLLLIIGLPIFFIAWYAVLGIKLIVTRIIELVH